LADGADCDDQDGVVPLALKMGNERITVTAVAIGDGPHVPFLKDVAAAGRGDFYLTVRARDLKAIFTKDVMKVSKSLIIEEPFIPAMDPSAPELSGINPSSVPPLLGYVTTSPKPAANIAMVSHKKDPILATWQYGLGRSAAFTSDCKSRWSARWLTWPDYTKFWAQVARSTMRKSSAKDFQTTVDMAGGAGRIIVDAVDDKGNFLNFLKFAGSVVGPDLRARHVAIDQTGPGRYEAAFEAKEVGNYVINVARKDGAQTSTETNVVNIPYPPEYKDISRNTSLLRRLAAETSGKFDPKSDEIFSEGFRQSKVHTDLWVLLALIAVLMLPMDVAVRRLALTPQQAMEILRRLMDLVETRLIRRKSKSKETASGTDKTVGALLRVKKDHKVQQKPVIPPRPAATCDTPPAEAQPLRVQPTAPKPTAPPTPATEKPQDEEDTTSRLLAAKKRARKSDE
ncbi:MAG: glutamine amidotransferase, partial [Armatimonadota bacterium]|nr:glutamine amidotransferase [Armatimonadota bacterium]